MSHARIAFIGLGRMGQPIARRLLDAGHDVAVFNRTPGKADALVAAGARRADTLAQACAGASVAFTMLADDAALCAVALDARGLVASLEPGAIHVAMGTHGVDAIRRVALAHDGAAQHLVAAPVLGRPDVAAAGQLGIVVAGPGVCRCALHTAARGDRPAPVRCRRRSGRRRGVEAGEQLRARLRHRGDERGLQPGAPARRGPLGAARRADRGHVRLHRLQDLRPPDRRRGLGPRRLLDPPRHSRTYG